jgi:hypothetical protein
MMVGFAAPPQSTEPLSFADDAARTAFQRMRGAVLRGQAQSELQAIKLVGIEKSTPLIGTPRDEPVEIRFQQPNRFVIVQNNGVRLRHNGFNGDIDLSSSFDFRRKESKTFASPAGLRTQRLHAARLMIAMFATPLRAVPLTVGVAAGEPTRLRFDYEGQPAFEVELGASGEPVAANYSESRVLPLKTTPQSGGSASLPPPTLVQIRMRLEQRKAVEGVNMPFYVVLEGGGMVLQEFRFKSGEVNPKLSDKDFQHASGLEG